MSEHLDRRLKSHTYHRPSAAVGSKMADVRLSFLSMVRFLDACIPECREKAVLFTELESAAMWGMKALALTDPEGEVVSPPQPLPKLRAVAARRPPKE